MTSTRPDTQASEAMEELAEFRSTLREVLREHCTEADVRAAVETETGHDEALWGRLVEVGLPALAVPEDLDGIGLGPIALEIAMEEAGAALLPGPLLSIASAEAMLAELRDTLDLSRDDAGDDPTARLLSALAQGETIATVALTGPAGTWDPAGVDVRTASGADGAGVTLSGTAAYVTDGDLADTLLAVARTDAGLAVCEVAGDAAGLSRTRVETFDPTTRLATLQFDGTPATPLHPLDVDATDTVARVRSHLLVALAGRQVGAMRAVFDLTVEYLRTRIQFGRPIGSYQALKHMAADLSLQVESATSAARAAARALESGSDDAPALAALAGFTCAENGRDVAAHAIQMHGGIGFTWEYPAHLYLRRARGDAHLFGSPAALREAYLTSRGI